MKKGHTCQGRPSLSCLLFLSLPPRVVTHTQASYKVHADQELLQELLTEAHKIRSSSGVGSPEVRSASCTHACATRQLRMRAPPPATQHHRAASQPVL